MAIIAMRNFRLSNTGSLDQQMQCKWFQHVAIAWLFLMASNAMVILCKFFVRYASSLIGCETTATEHWGAIVAHCRTYRVVMDFFLSSFSMDFVGLIFCRKHRLSLQETTAKVGPWGIWRWEFYRVGFWTFTARRSSCDGLAAKCMGSGDASDFAQNS